MKANSSVGFNELRCQNIHPNASLKIPGTLNYDSESTDVFHRPFANKKLTGILTGECGADDLA